MTVIKKCPTCEVKYTTKDKRQTYCGHKCAAEFMQSKRSVTTPMEDEDGLKNIDNPRYSKDEYGQWWYRPIGTKNHPRTRAHIEVCPVCNSRFLINIFHKGKQSYCTKKCGAQVHGRAIQGKYLAEESPMWRGGRKLVRGYALIYAPKHHTLLISKSPTRKYVFEHRVVMEEYLGRQLLPTENVHHKNGVRDDNRIENLELWAKFQPPGQRVADQIAHAIRFLESYGLSVNGIPNII